MAKLTNKQKRFCEEYVVDWNATRAAIAAGYSEKTARQIGQQNLSKLDIADYIQEIQQDLQKLAGVSALRNMIELRKIAYSNIANLKRDWLTEKEFDELSDDEKACISEIQTSVRSGGKEGQEWTETVIKFKLHSKLDAIDKLNKMLVGAYVPIKSDLTTDGKPLPASPIVFSGPPKELDLDGD